MKITKQLNVKKYIMDSFIDGKRLVCLAEAILEQSDTRNINLDFRGVEAISAKAILGLSAELQRINFKKIAIVNASESVLFMFNTFQQKHIA